MRTFSTVAAIAYLCVLPVAGGFAASMPAQNADAPAAATPATTAPNSTTPAAAKLSPAAMATADAAAKKHAKRTACLKDAKTKKLVGADKTSYLKNCIAAP
jgi:hypothetical protein